MNEWKELDIANLPPDILVGDYEFQKLSNQKPYFWEATSLRRIDIMSFLIQDNSQIRYRKRVMKAPTHTEIVTKYEPDDMNWYKVLQFDQKNKKYTVYFGSEGTIEYTKSWFTGRESSDIPPEEK